MNNIHLPWPDWKIVRYIGGGGYGKVYEIERNVTGILEKAAVKIIASCDDFVIVRNDNGIGGKIFLRMELLTSLQQILRERSLSEKEIIKLGKDISHALMLCERKQIKLC